MKFKEMKKANKVLFIINIILAVLAAIFFICGIVARESSGKIAKLLFENIDIGQAFLKSGLGVNETSAFITYLFGYLCGIGVIYGLLAYFGIHSAKTNKTKVTLALFLIASISTLFVGLNIIALPLETISIICLFIINSNNKKENIDDVNNIN